MFDDSKESETNTDSLTASSDGTYHSHYNGQRQGKLFPGLVGNHFVSYPLWSKRSERRKNAENAAGSSDESKRSKVTRVLEEFGDTTSIQGIPFAKKAKNPILKLFWSVVILTGLTLSVLHSYSVYLRFVAYDTTSAVSISHKNLDFPSITFCNKNALRSSKVAEFGNEQLKDFIHSIKPRSEYRVEMPSSGDDNNRKKRQLAGSHPKSTVGWSAPGGQQNKTLKPITAATVTPKTFKGEDAFQPHITSDRFFTDKMQSITETQDPGSDNPITSPTTRSGVLPDVIKDIFPNQDDTETLPNFFPAGEGPSLEGFDISDNSEIFEDKRTSGFLILKVLFEELLARIKRKQMLQMGHSLNEMMLSCSYDGKRCGPKNFSTSVHHQYGLCWTFNSGKLLDQSLVSMRSGADFGLSLILNVQTHEYLNGITDSIGVGVDIHDFRTMPFPAKGGLSVAAGTQTFVALKKINQTRLGGIYGECSDDGQFESYYFNYTYTLKGCINTCLDRNISSTCGCYRATRAEYYSGKDINALPRCTQQDQNCTYSVKKAFESGEMDCSCRQACHTVDYATEISNDIWPDESLWWALVDVACTRSEDNCEFMRNLPVAARERFLLKNFLHLKIYYRDLNVENINEAVAYDVYQFAADFGGAIGLWLGASALTVFELADLVIHCFVYIFTQKKKAPQKQTGKEDSDGTLPMGINEQIRLSNYLPKCHSNFSSGSQNNLGMNY